MTQIMHVIDHTRSGGAQSIVYHIIRDLRDSFEFSIAILGKEGYYSELYKTLNVPIYSLHYYEKWNPFILINLINLYKKDKPALIHTHLFKANSLGTIAASFSKTKRIIHDHTGIFPESLLNLTHYFPNPIIKKSFLRIYKISVNLCDQIIVLTPDMVNSYKKVFGVNDYKLRLLPNFVDIERFNKSIIKAKSGSIHRELNLALETKIVVMVGRLEPEKNWFDYLHVAHHIQEYSTIPCAFLMIGSGSIEQQLHQWVRDRQLNNIYFLGFRDDIADILVQSDVFLLTSKIEPFGIVILEAMAAGCPVIATRSGGPEYIISDGIEGLLVEVGDIEGMVEGVQKLLLDKEFSRNISTRAKELVSKSYNLDKFIIGLKKIYIEVLE